MVYSTRLESGRAQALAGSNPASSANGKFLRSFNLENASLTHLEGSHSGLVQRFTKPPYRKIPRVRIPPPPHTVKRFRGSVNGTRRIRHNTRFGWVLKMDSNPLIRLFRKTNRLLIRVFRPGYFLN